MGQASAAVEENTCRWADGQVSSMWRCHGAESALSHPDLPLAPRLPLARMALAAYCWFGQWSCLEGLFRGLRISISLVLSAMLLLLFGCCWSMAAAHCRPIQTVGVVLSNAGGMSFLTVLMFTLSLWKVADFHVTIGICVFWGTGLQ